MLGMERAELCPWEAKMSDREKDEQRDEQQDEQRDEQQSGEVEDLDATAEDSEDVKGGFHFVKRIDKTSPG